MVPSGMGAHSPWLPEGLIVEWIITFPSCPKNGSLLGTRCAKLQNLSSSKKSFMFFPGIKGVLKSFSVFLCCAASITKVRKYKTCLKKTYITIQAGGQSEEGVAGQVWECCLCISFWSFRLQSSELLPGSGQTHHYCMPKSTGVWTWGPALMSRQEGTAATPGWRFWIERLVASQLGPLPPLNHHWVTAFFDNCVLKAPSLLEQSRPVHSRAHYSARLSHHRSTFPLSWKNQLPFVEGVELWSSE